MFPQTCKFNGIPVSKPVLKYIVTSFGITVPGDIGQGDIILPFMLMIVTGFPFTMRMSFFAIRMFIDFKSPTKAFYSQR
jgi:hypothetical protein